MPAKTSAEVVARQKSCFFLLTALYRQGAAIAESLLGTVEPHLQDGDEKPEFFAPISGLGRRLKAVFMRLVADDERVYSANVRLNELRGERDDKARHLGNAVGRLRRTILNQFQAPKLEALGLASRNPRDPVALLRLADRVGKTFRRDDLSQWLGEPFFVESFDLRAQASEVASAADELRRVLWRINGAQRDLDREVTTKAKTQEEYDVLFLHTARTFEAFCRLAGERELADRVRPSIRRPGRTKRDPETEDAPSEEQETRGEETGSEDASSSPAETDNPPAATPAPPAA